MGMNLLYYQESFNQNIMDEFNKGYYIGFIVGYITFFLGLVIIHYLTKTL